MNATLEDVITRMSDPEWCLGLEAPFFDPARGRATGYDRAQVDTFVRRHRPPARTFDEALRRLLAEEDDLLLDSEGDESAQLLALRRRLGMGPDEVYLCAIELRAEYPSSWLAFTDRRLRVCTPQLILDVPYTDLRLLNVTTRELTQTVPTGFDTVGFSTSSTLTIRYQARSVTLSESDGTNDGLVTRLVSDAKKLLPAP